MSCRPPREREGRSERGGPPRRDRSVAGLGRAAMPPDIRILEDAEQIAGEAAQEFWGAVERNAHLRSRFDPRSARPGRYVGRRRR
jgi:hypothetical protein